MCVLFVKGVSHDVEAPKSLMDLAKMLSGTPQFIRFDDGSAMVACEESMDDKGEPLNVPAVTISIMKRHQTPIRGRCVYLTPSEVQAL